MYLKTRNNCSKFTDNGNEYLEIPTKRWFGWAFVQLGFDVDCAISVESNIAIPVAKIFERPSHRPHSTLWWDWYVHSVGAALSEMCGGWV